MSIKLLPDNISGQNLQPVDTSQLLNNYYCTYGCVVGGLTQSDKLLGATSTTFVSQSGSTHTITNVSQISSRQGTSSLATATKGIIERTPNQPLSYAFLTISILTGLIAIWLIIKEIAKKKK